MVKRRTQHAHSNTQVNTLRERILNSTFIAQIDKHIAYCEGIIKSTRKAQEREKESKKSPSSFNNKDINNLRIRKRSLLMMCSK